MKAQAHCWWWEVREIRHHGPNQLIGKQMVESALHPGRAFELSSVITITTRELSLTTYDLVISM